MVAYNILLSHKKENKSSIELGFSKEMNYLQNDYQNLINHTFIWEEIDVETVKERAEFMKIFTETIANPKIKIILVNTLPLEEIFSLKFIDLITEYPCYNFGQPIYNNSLNFYTYLLDFFCSFYLEKDLRIFEKIDAEDIHTYSPIGRLRLRKKNIENKFLRDKYFNNEFNLHKFALKLVLKFVSGASWRWIGGYHKAHIYCIKICKIIIEYGLVNDLECEEIKNALYMKIQNFKALEKCIDRDSKTIAETWITIWTDGLIKIRELYCEILIHHLYMTLDNDLEVIMKRFYQESINNKITLEKLENIISFNKTIIFENDFGLKMMDFLHGYILAQNTINNKFLTSKKIKTITQHFLNLFSNVKDPYMFSIKLMREDDYINYSKEKLNILKSDEEIMQEINVFDINLRKLIAGLAMGKYYNENQLLLILTEICSEEDLFSYYFHQKYTFEFLKVHPIKVITIMLYGMLDGSSRTEYKKLINQLKIRKKHKPQW